MHDPALTAKARDAVHAAYHSKIDKDLYDSVWQETLPAFPKSVVITEAQVNTVVDFMNEFDETPLDPALVKRSEEHTSELQSLMRISYAVFCLQKKHTISNTTIKT